MNKVKEIIRKDFDERCGAMVLSYLFDKGIELVRQISDGDIDALEGNPMMTDEFVQTLVRTARTVAKTCDLFQDILPYYMTEISPVKEIDLWQSDVPDHLWEEIMGTFEDEMYADSENGTEDVYHITVTGIVTQIDRERSV
jgi:hypothetical protein